MKRLAFLSALVVSLSTSAEVLPRFPNADRLARLQEAFPQADAAMERWWKRRAVPGLVYGIVIDGKLAHVRTWGVIDVDSRQPVTPETAFRIASMTKSFTAMAILKLRDAGKLSLDDPIERWIPQFARMKRASVDSPPITVRDLLTHGAGFPEDNPWGDQQLGISDKQLDSWLDQAIPFSTTTATVFEYSNYGFALLGRIINRSSGVPYDQFLEREILKPLGMTASSLDPAKIPERQRATGYRQLPGGTFSVERSLPHGAFGAMGGLVTTAQDLAKYIAFHLDAWPPRDDAENGPLRRSSVREMHRMWRESDLIVAGATGSQPLRAVSIGYGYGLSFMRDCRFRHIVGHGGGLPGWGSYMTWYPEHGVGLFAMANLTYAGPAGALNEVTDILRRSGGMQKRELPASPVLTATRDTIYRSYWQQWDDSAVQQSAANNLLLDQPAEIRTKEIARLRARAGQCSGTSDVVPENLLRGVFRINCENGPVHVNFTLAPTQPPAIQHLQFSERAFETGDNVCRP